ncbi:MAG: hypothetical protein AMXMBFR59_37700 [Rhodanobacteraceae bacterium]
MIAGVRWRYDVALEQFRRQWPGARLCSYEYQQAVMVLAPCGALVGVVLAEWGWGAAGGAGAEGRAEHSVTTGQTRPQTVRIRACGRAPRRHGAGSAVS